ncbi:MAG: succinylglutamate desuccinylase/aspartoacylase family protein [Cyclobacteriaceae bacterium]|nr:succinylglutamate desuccinylase/aspartoacylase family protein [Cyclobacteriaceae bacterium]MCH8515402.1 succinylglutamate desuccinylase/aspartoacylase family protein [Cyclobacteriaceae bacterium]
MSLLIDQVQAGSYQRFNIPITRLPSHTWLEMPVFVYKGKQEGPSLLLTAGLHGDEINGIETLRRLIVQKKLMVDRGRVVVVPLVNVYGFINNLRTLPDGRDLNRSFPGGDTGSLARRMANIVMDEILPWIDFGVDFHTGGSRITNFPQIRMDKAYEQNVALAKDFGAPVTLHSKLIDKSFRKEAHKVGKTILVYEGGESLRLDELSIQEGMDGIRRLMAKKGMRKSQVKPQESVFYPQTRWVRAKISGLFDSQAQSGAIVKKNEILGSLHDPYGETNIKIKSPVNGRIIGLNNMPVVNSGEALFHIATES